MSVNLKQDLGAIDLLGAVAVWIVFFTILFFISIVLNFYCVDERDDVTVFEEWAYRKNMNIRAGPHRRSVVARRVETGFKQDEV